MAQKIAFIGGGNMAQSLIGGLIADGHLPQNIYVSEPVAQLRQQLDAKFNVNTCFDNGKLLQIADCIILAVKPQLVKTAINEQAKFLQQRDCLLLSIAAGVSQQTLLKLTHPKQAIVRCMPNTPALLRLGATGMHANANCNNRQRQLAQSIGSAVGLAVWVKEESLLDSITAISGSGPAYFFAFIEALQHAAVELGLDENQANQLVVQTALGAAQMAKENAHQVAKLRQNVSSKGGTTEAALASFSNSNLNAVVQRACLAAFERAQQLSKDTN